MRAPPVRIRRLPRPDAAVPHVKATGADRSRGVRATRNVNRTSVAPEAADRSRLRLREIYLAQIKKAEADYFDRVKRAATAANGDGK